MSNITSFFLEIITNYNNIICDAEWIEVETPTGDFVIGPGHCDIVSLLKNKSFLSYKKRGLPIEQKEVTQGILIVAQGKVTIILGI